MKPRNSYVKVSIQPLQNNIFMYQQFARELSKNLHYMFPTLASVKKEPIRVSELSKEDMQGIRVIFGGKTTVAMKDDCTAISRCSPEDEYNPLLGAEIAIGRLVKKMRDDHE